MLPTFPAKDLCSFRGCSEALKKPGQPLKECQMMLDILTWKVQGNHGAQGTLYEKCELELRYLSPENNLSTNPNFETGVAKIQCGLEGTMTLAEKHACKSFRKEADPDSSDDNSESSI